MHLRIIVPKVSPPSISPAGSEKPLKYEGGRAVDDFVTYLKENAKASFKKSKDEL